MTKEKAEEHHSYEPAGNGFSICSVCGTAKHEKKFDGYIYWLAGIGYSKNPACEPGHFDY